MYAPAVPSGSTGGLVSQSLGHSSQLSRAIAVRGNVMIIASAPRGPQHCWGATTRSLGHSSTRHGQSCHGLCILHLSRRLISSHRQRHQKSRSHNRVRICGQSEVSVALVGCAYSRPVRAHTSATVQSPGGHTSLDVGAVRLCHLSFFLL
jgi:hypothetical protein